MPENPSYIPSDYPNERRLGDATLFRALLGNPGKSTFARYLQTGVIPPSDKKLGTLNRWYETTMAAAVEALPKARERQLTARGQLEGARTQVPSNRGHTPLNNEMIGRLA
jgi:hypothetical protein